MTANSVRVKFCIGVVVFKLLDIVPWIKTPNYKPHIYKQ